MLLLQWQYYVTRKETKGWSGFYVSSLPVSAVAAMTESKALMLSWSVIILMIILDTRPSA